MATPINVETFFGQHRGRTDLDRLRANRYGQPELLVPTLARDLHFASAADAETDWNVANPTNPTIYIHSETTPATDYGSVAHDATDLIITSVGGGIRLVPVGDVQIDNGFGLIIGSATQITISDGDGSTNLIPELQVLGTAAADGSLVVASFNTTNTRAVSPHIALVKGAAATQVATTAVADNEVVGSIIAYGSDSADFESPVAAIEFVVDDVSGPTTGQMGGSLEFYTTADAGETLTLSFTINNDQNIYVANANGVVVGHTSQVAVLAATPELQVLGTAAADSGLFLLRSSADTAGPIIYLAKARDAIGTFTTAITTGDVLGGIEAIGADTADLNANANAAAAIRFVSSGTIAADRIPGEIRFLTATDAAPSVLTQRMSIDNAGHTTLAAGSTPVSVATTPGTAHAGAITSTGGLGGNTTIGTTGTGGIGGGYSFTGGAGGTANSATTAATGGAGGAFVATTGAGAAAAVAGVTSTGGAGGAITQTTGAGGAVSLAVSGTATGGAAGVLTIRGGVGGAVTATTGTNVGGAGGDIAITAGAGGAASGGAGNTGGRGGNVTITPGAAGSGGTPDAGTLQLAGGFVFESSSATEIGISVTNEAMVVGSEGTLVIPYLSQTGAAFTDAIGGDLNGAIGINYDSDTGPTSTLEARSNGSWLSVAVTGYLMQNRVPWARETTFLSHPNQVFEDDGKVWIDESRCYICGEKMVPGEQVTFWANGPTERGVHAIFGHVHAERNDYIRGLETRIIELEQKLLVPVFA